MKIAICFSGAIRDFNTCIPSIQKYLLNNLNADIFLHLWKFSNDNSLNINFKWRDSNIDNIAEKNIINILKPKSYIIDSYNLEWESKITSVISTDKFIDGKSKQYSYNCCGMYYKIFQSYLLAKKYSIYNNVNYDLIIRARLDFIWENPIYLEDFINLNDDNIFLVKDRYATMSKLNTNDKFFAGTPLVMNYMSSIYLYLNKYQKQNIQIEGQTILENHIKNKNLNVIWLGDKNTYYKCMDRHNIYINNINIYINIDNKFIENELAYYLLYNGYNVYLDKTDIYINYLESFDNFIYHIAESDILYEYSIVNDKKDDINSKYLFIINNSKNTINNENTININYNIIITLLMKLNNSNIKYFVRYICSLLNNNIINGKYVFNDILQIENIDTDENILYKYDDHGYYRSKYKIKDGNKHIIIYNNIIKLVNRDDIIIYAIFKYYTNGYLPY